MVVNEVLHALQNGKYTTFTMIFGKQTIRCSRVVP